MEKERTPHRRNGTHDTVPLKSALPNAVVPSGDRLVQTGKSEVKRENGVIFDTIEESYASEDFGSPTLYLSEIGHAALLTGPEEVELAKAIEAGKVADQRLQDKQSLTDENPEDLMDAIQAGAEARRRLIEANLRLVVSVARRYMNRGLPFSDLIQEGNIGLMRAVEKFDYRLGFKFSTYAYWWIRQGVTRSISDQARTIRIPVNMIETLNKLGRTTFDLQQQLGREPTDVEIAAAMKITVEKVGKMYQMMKYPISLETPVGDEEDTLLGDFIEDTSAQSPEDAGVLEVLREDVVEVLDSLSPRERKVLDMRYGFTDRPYTLDEIGNELGVTRERIRQIETKAIKKLRHPDISNRLRAIIPER